MCELRECRPEILDAIRVLCDADLSEDEKKCVFAVIAGAEFALKDEVEIHVSEALNEALNEKLMNTVTKDIMTMAVEAAYEKAYPGDPGKYYGCLREREASKWLGMGEQWLGKRRNAGKPVPDHFEEDGVYLYTIFALVTFAEERISENLEMFSAANRALTGLKMFSKLAGRVEQDIEKARKAAIALAQKK